MGNGSKQSDLSTVVLFSGGLDSTVLLDMTIRGGLQRVQPIFFTYGSLHNAREYKAATLIMAGFKNVNPLICLPIPQEVYADSNVALLGRSEITDAKSTIIPFRNGIMLSMAAAWADAHGYGAVSIAAHKSDDPYPDCRPGFMERMWAAIYAGTDMHVQMIYPFVGQLKSSIVAEGALIHSPLALTWSCYLGGEVHCGTCPTCLERKKAFQEAQVNDPTEYLE